MEVFYDGSEIVQQEPHPAFRRILEYGFRISYYIEQEVKLPQALLVKVLHGDNSVAEAEFTDGGLYAYCQNIQVAPGYRRKGIATAVYVFAEKVLGKRLYNFCGSGPEQSLEAKELWAQSNRPFGCP